MSRKKTLQKPPEPPRPGFAVIRAALAVALAISAFLAWRSFQSGAVPGCGPDSGCDRVLNSRWGKALGLPVSLLALAAYGTLLAETFRRTIRWPLVSAISWGVVGAVAWFTILQAAVVKAFCPYCMTAHAAGLLAAVLFLARSPARFSGAAALGGAAAVLLAAIQAITPATAPKQVSMAPAANPAVSRIFPILGGQFQLDLAHLPVSGDLDGTNRVVKLFDYTCHHCRELHHLMHQYQQSNSVTVISLPVPLDPACNPIMTRSMPDHVEACEYARAGLAVFYANPEKFQLFSDWLFTPLRPYAVAEARAHAASLVGTNEFNAALRDPRVEQQLRTNIAIYVANSQRGRSGRMPQLIFAGSASYGAVADLPQLQRIMDANLHPPPPPPRLP